jgi:hypothetical protein
MTGLSTRSLLSPSPPLSLPTPHSGFVREGVDRSTPRRRPLSPTTFRFLGTDSPRVR